VDEELSVRDPQERRTFIKNSNRYAGKMKRAYLDTSAYLKEFSQEAGSETIPKVITLDVPSFIRSASYCNFQHSEVSSVSSANKEFQTA